MNSQYVKIISNLISKPKYLMIIIMIFIAYHIIIAYITTFQLNISLIDRLNFHIYMLLQDPIRMIFQLIIPIAIGVYIILSTCNSTRAKLSVPLTATLASGISCLGCTVPMIASAGVLSSVLGSFISLLVPISFLIIMYSVMRKMDEISLYNTYCQ
ncbi:MAG: hypothetical protein QXL02_02675 [Candidatus Anstonellales archaeon]